MANQRLKIDITAKDRTKAAIQSVRKGLATISRSAKAISLAFGVAGTGLAILTKSIANSIDKTGKLSRQLGISARELETFKLAAELGGTTLEKFTETTKQLSKNVFDFITKGTGEAADSFKALGLSQRDLEPVANNSVELFGLLADRLNQMPDGAVKTAVAFKLLGASGVELTTALEGGSEGIRRIAKEAERFGLILSDKQVRAVEKANDEFTKLFAVFNGIARQIVAELFPAIGELVAAIREKLLGAIEKGAGGVQDLAKIVATKVREMAKGVTLAGISTLNAIGRGFLEFSKFINKGIQLLVRAVRKSAETVRPVIELFDKLRNPSSLLPTVSQDSFFSSIVPERFIEKPKLKEEKVASSFDNLDRSLRDFEDSLEGTQSSIDDTIGKMDGFFSTTRSFVEEFKLASDTGTESIQTFNTETEKLTQSLVKSKQATISVDSALNRVKGTAQEFGDIISSGFQDAVFQARTFSDALKGVAQDLIRLTFRKSITEPLAQGIASTISGGFFGNIFGGLFGGKQFGGLVQRGKATIVGEAGPELFVPSTTGSIVPNHRLGGGGSPTVVQNITINAGVPEAVRREVFNLMPFIKQEAAEGVIAARNRGGAMAFAMGVKG